MDWKISITKFTFFFTSLFLLSFGVGALNYPGPIEEISIPIKLQYNFFLLTYLINISSNVLIPPVEFERNIKLFFIN